MQFGAVRLLSGQAGVLRCIVTYDMTQRDHSEFQCKATNAKGGPCGSKFPSTGHPDYCVMHDPDPPLEPLVYKVEQVAQLLNVDRKTVYDLVKSGELRSVRLGRAIRIPKAAVREYLGMRDPVAVKTTLRRPPAEFFDGKWDEMVGGESTDEIE